MTQPPTSPSLTPDVIVRPLVRDDLPEAVHVFRLAFGTFLELPDPMTFAGDADFVQPRWRANPHGAFAAEREQQVAGFIVSACLGSVGFFGPLAIRPDLWDRGIGQKLISPVMDHFAEYGVQHGGLFTFATSSKHHALYQKFGFYPRFLTAILSKPVMAPTAPDATAAYSRLTQNEQEAALGACRQLTDTIYNGLDVTAEIQAVQAQRLGETVLLWHGSRLEGFAVCHCGEGTEGGSGACYLKFGAVASGVGAATALEHLLQACEAFAVMQGAAQLDIGVNLGCEETYRQLLAADFRVVHLGVAMERPNEPGYHHKGNYVLDDWR